MEKTPELNLYTTRGHECSYLPEQEANTVFVDPNYPVDAHVYSRLSEIGFRRSGINLYRPHCPSCNACIPIRILADDFKASRQQRRCWNRNQDIEVVMSDDISSGEHYALYEHYINSRHSDGDMYPPSREQYESFLGQQWDVTHYIEFRLAHRLLGLAVTDGLDQGLSAVYSFFDTSETRRSLGVYSVLFQIALAKKLGLPYVYLGYWIENSPKMAYKNLYQPHELYIEGKWHSKTRGTQKLK